MNALLPSVCVGLFLISQVIAPLPHPNQSPDGVRPDATSVRLIDLGAGDHDSAPPSPSDPSLRRDACPDSFVIFGGPGTLQGKFQTDRFAPDMQGWTGEDFTQFENAWRVSTFNAATLGAHGEGNHAMWAGYTAEEKSGWSTPPGYGNGWRMDLGWSSGPLTDTGRAQTVALDFLFHLDTEPGYDFVKVEYDSAGHWRTVLTMDGDTRSPSGEFAAPGTTFASMGALPIAYAGNDYGGPDRDEIALRIRFESDAAWSDEDGLWDTDGAMQVDDFFVGWSDTGGARSDSENFEGSGPFSWLAIAPPIAGDFSKVFPRTTDIDPCHENTTPVMTFIDDGTPPRNDVLGRSTGGAVSPNWSYGVPGGWVVNYDGGISFGEVGLDNGVVSPPIPWDVPGTCDDGDEFRWFSVEADWFIHTPGSVLGIIGWRWSTDGGASWSPVNTFGGYPVRDGVWERARLAEVPIESEGVPTHLQIVLLVRDLRAYYPWFPLDSSPSPIFDDVRVVKFGRRAPSMNMHFLQNAFAFSGGADASTPQARDALDIPVTPIFDDPADGFDAVEAWASVVLPGVQVADLRLLWALDKNPLFEDAIRQVPQRPTDANVDVSVPGQWYGEVVGVLRQGNAVEGYWNVDMPKADFFYPGDVLRYALQVTDTQQNVFTLPRDVSGLRSGAGHDIYWTLRGLPTLGDASGQQPPLLIVQRAGDPLLTRLALGQLGLVQGEDFDMWVQRGSGTVNFTSAGIGASGRGGATAEQIAGYESIVFLTGTRTGDWPLIGDGVTWDSSNEVELLTTWREMPGTRNLHVSGSDIAATLTLSSPMLTFLQNVLGTEYLDTNVRDEIGGQLTNGVVAADPSFTSSFAVRSACAVRLGPDSVAPFGGGAWAGHHFLDASGSPSEAAASILRVETFAGDTKRTILFPFGLTQLTSDHATSTSAISSAARLLGEVLGWFGTTTGGGSVTPASAPRPLLSAIRSSPNPFNPRAEIAFELGRRAAARVDVFDLRGERVVTLVDGVLDAGAHRVRWDGTDDAGAMVASGVYLIEVRADTERTSGKVALIR